MCNWIVNPYIARLEIAILKQKRKWQTRLFTLRNFLSCTWILMHVLDRLQKIKRYFWYYRSTQGIPKVQRKRKSWYVWNYTIRRKWNSQWNVMYFLLWTIIKETEPSMSSDNFDFGDTYGKFLIAFSFKKKLLYIYEATLLLHSVSWIEDAMREI